MVVIPRDGAASSAWVRQRSRYQTRSRSTLILVGEGFLRGLCSPLSRRLAFERFGDSRDVLGRVAATAAGNIDQPCPCKIAQITCHVLRPEVEPGFREGIRQTGIWVARDRYVCLFRELLQERIHQIGTERAVEPHRQRFYVLHRVPERLSRLCGDHRLAATPHRRRDHYRQLLAVLIEHFTDGDKGRLGVQRVEDCLYQEQVYAAGD